MREGLLGSRKPRLFLVLCSALVLASFVFISQSLSEVFKNDVKNTLGLDSLQVSSTRSSMVTIRKARERKLEEYTRNRNSQCDDQGKWYSVTLPLMSYTYTWSQFETDPEESQPKEIGLQACEVDAEDGQSGWLVYRFGPMIGVGGYDKHEVLIGDLPPPKKAKYITGKMAAPVYPNGEVAGFPPVHTHHNMLGLSGVVHAFEAHGDAVCTSNLGGNSCYLISYPKGHGIPFVNDTDVRDYLTINANFNDVRRNDETTTPNPMIFYGEVGIEWTSIEDTRPISSLALHMAGAKHSFAANIVTKRQSLRWNTGVWPANGEIIISPEDQMPWFHAHRSYFTAFWAFASSPEDLGLTSDLLKPVDDNNVTKNGPLDMFDKVWTPEDPIQALSDKIGLKGKESMRCWLMHNEDEKVLEFVEGSDSSSKYPSAWQQDWKASYYDRAGEVHCKPWSFKKGERYTVVALNGLDPHFNWTHDQSDFFTMMQHNILFLPYKSHGPELGPTMEIYGNFETNSRNQVRMPWTYVPQDVKNRTDYFIEDGEHLKLSNKLIKKFLSKDLNASFIVDRNYLEKIDLDELIA
ncbi:hypothetical protein HOP50_14g73370 [Chloropicon primus]|uniref:Uncharacterized protein n=1 Tax=Chloropicon primus TaxID=1764295 RepID=A0A5B8MWI0_9CHLO|nr:hypothetical protein A3770_14p73150 [Chloropicon primus]UPR04006.1 hypothetical protein HOP50_14g73370 [Chloropicon primus]|eukprot:QDZ24797.1 hypothetical protein A3770_14p73150 [Chloropicon primus]